MQVSVFGDMISVKNMKEILKQLDDDNYLIVDKFKNLAIMKRDYFSGTGTFIDFYLEEIRFYKGTEEPIDEED